MGRFSPHLSQITEKIGHFSSAVSLFSSFFTGANSLKGVHKSLHGEVLPAQMPMVGQRAG
jgi:hypothetical protein